MSKILGLVILGIAFLSPWLLLFSGISIPPIGMFFIVIGIIALLFLGLYLIEDEPF